jgi:hypothetical protein
MRRLLTGYAISYNRRHRRWGHLFQNRYKSIIWDEDAYFAELVCYIHLNPLRARLVKSLTQLNRYRWSGHGDLMGKIKNEKVSIKELRSGSRRNEVSGVRALIAMGLRWLKLPGEWGYRPRPYLR